jgi:hypothetical protein
VAVAGVVVVEADVVVVEAASEPQELGARRRWRAGGGIPRQSMKVVGLTGARVEPRVSIAA